MTQKPDNYLFDTSRLEARTNNTPDKITSYLLCCSGGQILFALML